MPQSGHFIPESKAAANCGVAIHPVALDSAGQFAKQESHDQRTASHDLADVEALCDRVVLRRGRIGFSGTPGNCRARYDATSLEQAFLRCIRQTPAMYQDFFGLRAPPFGITPDPAFFFKGSLRGDLLDALCYAVERGEGIIKVTGEVGCGKTMLCRMLVQRLPPHVDCLYLANPTLHPREVCYALAGELGLPCDGWRVDEVIRALQAALIERHAARRQVVLLVEEAQAMPLDTLEELRLLSNLETAHSKLLQMVLFGQPELDAHLEMPHMRQLKERITQSFTVPRLPRGTVPDFLDFRMRAAGYRGPGAFSDPAALHIARVSNGIIRRINILADKALLAAYIDEERVVRVRHARAAVQDSPFRRPALVAALPWFAS